MKNLNAMTAFSNQYAKVSGTKFCSQLSISAVVGRERFGGGKRASAAVGSATVETDVVVVEEALALDDKTDGCGPDVESSSCRRRLPRGRLIFGAMHPRDHEPD